MRQPRHRSTIAAIFIKDLQGRYLQINAAFVRYGVAVRLVEGKFLSQARCRDCTNSPQDSRTRINSAIVTGVLTVLFWVPGPTSPLKLCVVMLPFYGRPGVDGNARPESRPCPQVIDAACDSHASRAAAAVLNRRLAGDLTDHTCQTDMVPEGGTAPA